MMHFPGGSNTRENLLPYKYTRKKRTEGDYLVVSKMDLSDGTEEMYDALFVRSTNSTTFCSFVLQTLRRSVRSFYKLYEVLFVRSATLRCSVRLLNKNERLFCTFDLQLNVVMTSTIDISTIVLRTDGSSTRVTRTDLVYWKGTLLSHIISVLSTALILWYYCLWNA